MTNEDAMLVLASIEASQGWKIIAVTREDVAAQWEERAPLTADEWEAFEGTDAWADLEADLRDVANRVILDAIEEAEKVLS